MWPSVVFMDIRLKMRTVKLNGEKHKVFLVLEDYDIVHFTIP